MLVHGHFEGTRPGDLLVATLRRGDTVPLRIGATYGQSCEGSLASVQWRSTAPDVAAVTARDPATAELHGVAPGETRVSADVVLADGSRLTAELHGVPSPGSPLMRVYAVRVVR